jgi:hypothetical protein
MYIKSKREDGGFNLTAEMISNTDDYFKFKMCNYVGVLGDPEAKGEMGELWYP